MTTTDPNSNKSRFDTDVDGRMVETANYLTSGAGSPGWIQTLFHFAPFGQMDRVSLPTGTVETTQYDLLGRVSKHFSPDGGTTVYISYDDFGEMLSYVHAELLANTSLYYDKLGRSTGWTTTDPESGLTTSATLSYDTQANGLGKLASAISSDQVTIVPSHDSYGRTTSMSETVNGQVYTVGMSYDLEGRPSQLNYPLTGLSLYYNYNQYEYLSSYVDARVHPAGPEGGTIFSYYNSLLSVKGRNPDGSLASASIGAGLNLTLGERQYLLPTVRATEGV